VDRGLAGKVALVTGGSRGIGLTTTLAELEQLKVPATSVSANLSIGHGCRTALDHCTRLLGPPDILINNAGATSNTPISDLLTDTIDDARNLKLSGYRRLAQLTIPTCASKAGARRQQRRRCWR